MISRRHPDELAPVYAEADRVAKRLLWIFGPSLVLAIICVLVSS